MGFFNKVFGGADGVRETMREAYARHLREVHEGKLRSTDSPHRTALYGALGSRYQAGSRHFTELDLWTELAPFLAMSEEAAVAVLVEYVILMELPQQAKLGYVAAAINKALQSTEEPQILQLAAVALGRGVRWATLLSPNCVRRLSEAVKELEDEGTAT